MNVPVKQMLKLGRCLKNSETGICNGIVQCIKGNDIRW